MPTWVPTAATVLVALAIVLTAFRLVLIWRPGRPGHPARALTIFAVAALVLGIGLCGVLWWRKMASAAMAPER